MILAPLPSAQDEAVIKLANNLKYPVMALIIRTTRKTLFIRECGAIYHCSKDLAQATCGDCNTATEDFFRIYLRYRLLIFVDIVLCDFET